MKRIVFEVLLDTDDEPSLAEQWQTVDADEKVYALIANRSTDEKVKADAAAKLDEFRAQRAALQDQIAAETPGRARARSGSRYADRPVSAGEVTRGLVAPPAGSS